MYKLKMQTPNLTAQNIDKIAALFPNCITEMLDEEKSTPDHKVYKRGINFELLKQMLSPDVVDGDEAYEFTWVGKKASIVEANKPIRKTLRPCPAESKNWDDTENLYIEGDNLEVLKLLQESYLGKVKMIYIDPPYNTGNDFIYADDFMRSQDEENRQMGMYDEDENRLFKNNDSNGRFHSDWCSMMYSRLVLARNLLTDDGVIFISIDEHEVENLTKICDEVFSSINHIGTIVVKSNPRGSMSTSEIASLHEYLLIYAKNKWETNIIGHPLSANMTSEYKYRDTNMKDVYYSADEYSQTNLEELESNIKEDRTDLDLLFGCLLDWGLPLSMPYRSEKIDNCTVHTYAPGDAALNVPDALIACFDSNVPENVIKEIAKRKPRRAVFRDSSFASSPEKINVFEIFKLYAPDTDVKVI